MFQHPYTSTNGATKPGSPPPDLQPPMSLYSSFTISTSSGIVVFKDAANSAKLAKALKLTNEMIVAKYLNFSGMSQGEKDEHNVQTYIKNSDVVKSVDLRQKAFVLSLVYSSLTVKPADANKFSQLLAQAKSVFEKLVLAKFPDDDTELDFVQVKQAVRDSNFAQFFQGLVDKVFAQVGEPEEKPSETIPVVEHTKKKKLVGKKGRKWTDDGTMTEENGGNLDFTEVGKSGKSEDNFDVSEVSTRDYGTATSKGFIIKELDTILSSSDNETATKTESFGFLRQFIGGKTITKEDLEKSVRLIKDNLIKKNVSAEIADKLVGSLEPQLLGTKTKNFESIETKVKQCLEKELTKILTPNTSINLLQEIEKKKKAGKGPYVISVVGVNGVGKSTNLSKLAFWLLNNKYNVLIAACDTFRSGAVEQLKVHERNLNKLVNSLELSSKIELFEQGYGNLSKVASIARSSIEFAKKNDFDIVLMDTAGRRHNDSKLMAPLKDFALAAQPDKIIMVGEALVGTDSVMQAQNFNKSFVGANRKLDFFIISKCDTVGDLIGTMVNMVYSTGIPILFIGVGQTYTDLRRLSVEWAVDTLMR